MKVNSEITNILAYVNTVHLGHGNHVLTSFHKPASFREAYYILDKSSQHFEHVKIAKLSHWKSFHFVKLFTNDIQKWNLSAGVDCLCRQKMVLHDTVFPGQWLQSCKRLPSACQKQTCHLPCSSLLVSQAPSTTCLTFTNHWCHYIANVLTNM